MNPYLGNYVTAIGIIVIPIIVGLILFWRIIFPKSKEGGR